MEDDSYEQGTLLFNSKYFNTLVLDLNSNLDSFENEIKKPNAAVRKDAGSSPITNNFAPKMATISKADSDDYSKCLIM